MAGEYSSIEFGERTGQIIDFSGDGKPDLLTNDCFAENSCVTEWTKGECN